MPRYYAVFRIFISAIVAAALLPVIGEFFIELAKEKGLYQHPSERLERTVNWLLAIADLPGFKISVAVLASFAAGMWLDTIVRRKQASLENVGPKSDLEFVFDETSERFVRFSMEKNRLQRFVGIHNRGPKTVFWVSVRVLEAKYARIFNETQIQGSPAAMESILFERGALDPDATELFEVMVGSPDDSNIGRMAFYNRPHRFFLEARARDVLTVRAEFEHHDGKIKMIST